jgi:hypothetical protein
MTTKSNAVATVSNPWERATLWINDKQVEWGAELVLLRGEENDVTVEAPLEIARTLKMGLVNSGGLNITASPVFDESVIPANGKFNWKITPGAGKSGRITLSFYNTDVLVPWEHRSLVISSNLADEADVKIDDRTVPLEGNWFFWNVPKTITLVAKPGSPLAGLPVQLNYKIKSGLNPLNLESAPAFESEQTTHSWKVFGKSRKGTFQLSLSAKGVPTPITVTTSKLLSDNLADEADVRIDNMPITDESNLFIRDKPKIVELIPKLDSPMRGLEFKIGAVVVSGLDNGDLVSVPGFSVEGKTFRWGVTGRNNAGAFQLTISCRGMTTPITLPISTLQ